jgi:hypothetical protein
MSQPDTTLYGRQVDDREVRALGLEQLRLLRVARTPTANVVLRIFTTQLDDTRTESGAVVIDAAELDEFIGEIYGHTGTDPLLVLHRMLRPEVYGYQDEPRAWTPELMSEVNEAVEDALRTNRNPHARLDSGGLALPTPVS